MLSTIASLEEYSQCLQTLAMPFSPVENSLTRTVGVHWQMARMDLLDAELSGNKLFKLLPFLQQARNSGITQLVSFGGVYSNHLHALAAAGKRFGFSVVAMVRGYESQPTTATLADIRRLGAQIRFVDKTTYRKRYDDAYLAELQRQYPDSLIIPEGGAGEQGITGIRLLADMLVRSVSEKAGIFAVATGTGTTLAGLLASGAFKSSHTLYGYAALKNADDLHRQLACLQSPLPQWQVFDEYCFGGFAKMNHDLARYIDAFEEEQSIPLDPVYTAKLCFAIEQQIRQGIIPPGSNIVTLHTGGLQGRCGLQDWRVRNLPVDYQEPCRSYV